MNISISNIEISNFKGIKYANINFSSLTSIYGQNGSGKTCIFDAFCWLLFGKNSAGKKDFSLKTINKDGNIIPKIEHCVKAVIKIDDNNIELKTILNEKWSNIKGSNKKVLKGNETTYFINGQPVKMEEYKNKINQIINEDLFKIITNPLYFNSLKTEDMRNILISLIGGISDMDIINSDDNLSLLKDIINKQNIEQLKKENLNHIKRIKEELKKIPVRIDEINRSIAQCIIFEHIEEQLNCKKEEFRKLEKEILLKSHINSKENQRLNYINNLKEQLNQLELKSRNKYIKEKNNIEMDLHEISLDISELKTKVSNLNLETEQYYNKAKKCIEDIRKNELMIIEKQNIVFDASNCICPTCKREFDYIKKEEIKTKFYNDNNQSIQEIKNEISRLNQLYEQYNKILNDKINCNNENKYKLNELKKIYDKLKDNIKNLSIPDLYSNKEYICLKSQISELETNTNDNQNINSLKNSYDNLALEIKQLEDLLIDKLQTERAKKRLKEVEQEEKSLIDNLAKYENIDILIEQFNIKKMNLMEYKINLLFDTVKFKLFEKLINGNINPCCKATVNGVPFSDLNTAMKINAGLDIINTLSKFYNTYAPIFIDNKESINNLIKTKSQMIYLIVDQSPQLKIVGGEKDD